MQKCETERTNRDATPTRGSASPLICSRTGWALLASAALCLPAWRVSAQAAEPAAPAAAPAPGAATPAAAAPATAPPAATDVELKPVVGGPDAPQPEVQAETPEVQPALAAPPAEPVPVVEPVATPALKIGVGLRTGLALLVNQPNKDKVGFTLHDGLVDQVHIRPYFSGQLTKRVGVVANFEVGTQGGLGRFNVLDAIVQLKIFDELQLWIGQHIPANDRNNTNGPFFHNSWNFAIDVPSYGFDQGARDRGFTFWGLIANGLLKYHLSLVDLQPGRNIENARFAGRVTVNLLDPENYYYTSGTYYGAQDTLALGGVFSYQNGVGDNDNDFVGFSFDGLFEKRAGGAGTFTLEAGYWNFENVGYNYVVNQGTIDSGVGVVGPAPGQAVLAGASWLTADDVGPGKIQVNARFQYGDYSRKAKDAEGNVIVDAEGREQHEDYKNKVLDVGLGYIVDGFNHRWHVNYRHADRGGAKEDMIQIGAQIQI